MLTPNQYDVAADAILKLYHEFEDVVLQAIARRLVGLNFASAAWQVQRLNETGALYEDILRELARLTGQSERQVAEILRQAGVQAVRFDDRIYRAAGLEPLPLNLSPQMTSVLSIAIQRTNGSMRNLTQTTVLTAQQAFVQAADMAFLQVSSGAMSYDQAIRAAVSNVGASGLEVLYPSGRRDKLDVAMRRTVLTGVGQAAGQLQWARADEMGADLVQTSAHIGARPSHQPWQGRIFSRSGTHPLYPNFVAETGWGTVTGLGGVNCVVGETLVSGPAVRAAYRREYSGELIVIRTASGKELTVTPNHPVLTGQGWVAAGLLAEGDNVISRADLDGVNGACPDPHQSEPRIEDVFDSLAQGEDVLRLPASAGHFHGDVSDGEVNIVFPESLLWDWVYAAFFEHDIELPFSDAAELPYALAAKSALDQVGIGALHAADGVVGGFGNFCASIRAESLHPGAHGRRAASGKRDTDLRQVAPNQALGDPDLGGNFVLPHPRVVHGQKLIGRDAGLALQVDSPVVGFGDPIPLEAILNGVEGTSIFIGDELVGAPRHEELDYIIFIERKSTQGSSIHVYNLETEGGWYFANGILTHNCRHSWYPFFEGLSENAYSEAMREHLANESVDYRGRQLSAYEASQVQRGIERRIREWKRRMLTLEAAGLDAAREGAKVRQWQERMRDFLGQTGLRRQRAREQV